MKPVPGKGLEDGKPVSRIRTKPAGKHGLVSAAETRDGNDEKRPDALR
ncbi:MAG: hypothetical protein KDA79_15980 [Planctomycetaceae bacterium]|nr:hypothetical protein [Planctomycetaceae bacterium]